MFKLDKPCVLCKNDIWTVARAFGDYKIVRCMCCHLLTLYPQPSKQEIKDLYCEEYFIHNLEKQMPYDIPSIEMEILKRKYIVRWLHDTVKIKPGTLLEVGCATGFLLKAFEQSGWDVTGIEISSAASSYAREKLHLNVLTGEISTSLLDKKVFDVIIMMHTLEHLLDPISAVSELSNHLAANGYLIIQVPNATSLESKLFGLNWERWSVPYHIFHFSPNTLRQLLKKCGLVIVHREFALPVFERKLLEKRKKRTVSYQNQTFNRLSTMHRFRRILSRLNKSLPIGRDMTVIAQFDNCQ